MCVKFLDILGEQESALGSPVSEDDFSGSGDDEDHFNAVLNDLDNRLRAKVPSKVVFDTFELEVIVFVENAVVVCERLCRFLSLCVCLSLSLCSLSPSLRLSVSLSLPLSPPPSDTHAHVHSLRRRCLPRL